MDAIVKVEGKVLEKFLDVISNGIGTLYRPRAIRKEADAKAYAIRTIANAKNEAIAEGHLMEAETLSRINERLVGKEKERQNNIDEVVEAAAEDLQKEKVVSDEPVNKDWSTRFFNIVQDVSDSDMKQLWAKVLAGEVKSPCSYSLRTLELLRNLSKQEAELFLKVSQLVLKEREYFIFKTANNDLSKFGISYLDIAKLIEIGLIQAGTFVSLNYESSSSRDKHVFFMYNNKILLRLNIPKESAKISFPVHLLTQSGKELYQLISVNPNIDYLKEVASSLKGKSAYFEYNIISDIDKDGNLQVSAPAMRL